MTIKLIGLIRLRDPAAFEVYRSQVGITVERYNGTVTARGSYAKTYWNELPCGECNAFVELTFPTSYDADRWANSPEYQALLPIRSRAMDLTLLQITT
jgi:uncharacterized protein (DUF1330 family)